MFNCEFVSTSPDRPYIYYEVLTCTDIGADLQFIVNSFKEQTVEAPHVLVYCHSLDMCASLYAHFHYELGEHSHYPPGSDQICSYRLFGMFHASTPAGNKDIILRSLVQPDGVV